MAKKFQKLNEAFNIEPETDLEFVETKSEVVEHEIEKVDNSKVDNSFDDAKKDYEYTRANLYSIIEKGQEAINSVLDLAKDTETARAYEVVGQLIKNVSDATDKLLDLQKKIKDLDNVGNSKSSGPRSVTNNAVFVGSTTELVKFMKGQLQGDSDNK
jgi:hypothetical protein